MTPSQPSIGPSFSLLPSLSLEGIASFLGPKDFDAADQTCQALHRACQQIRQERLQSLYSVRETLEPFGIFPKAFLTENEASDLRATLKRRVKDVWECHAKDVQNFSPEILLHTFNPPIVKKFFQIAYDRSLANLLSEHSPFIESTPLEERVRLIHAWLQTEGPKRIDIINCCTARRNADSQMTCVPKEIEKLSSLKSLKLSGNRISTLPKEIGNLTSLFFLLLRNNSLSSLPIEMGNLKSLVVLDVGNNRLSSLPPLPPSCTYIARGNPLPNFQQVRVSPSCVYALSTVFVSSIKRLARLAENLAGLAWRLACLLARLAENLAGLALSLACLAGIRTLQALLILLIRIVQFPIRSGCQYVQHA